MAPNKWTFIQYPLVQEASCLIIFLALPLQFFLSLLQVLMYCSYMYYLDKYVEMDISSLIFSLLLSMRKMAFLTCRAFPFSLIPSPRSSFAVGLAVKMCQRCILLLLHWLSPALALHNEEFNVVFYLLFFKVVHTIKTYSYVHLVSNKGKKGFCKQPVGDLK